MENQKDIEENPIEEQEQEEINNVDNASNFCNNCSLAVTTDQKIYCGKCNSSCHVACALFTSDGKLNCKVCEKKDKNKRVDENLLNKSKFHSTMINNNNDQVKILTESFNKYKAELADKMAALQKENENLKANRELFVAENAQNNSQRRFRHASFNINENSQFSQNSSSTDMMNKILERQMFQDERSYQKELPQVNKIGSDWLVMYKSYANSKKLFSDSENVIRLQKSIKSEEIIKLGGPNLFCVDTYDETMNKINQLINRPNDLLRQNLRETLNIEVSHDKKDKQSLIDYIISINHLASLQNKIGTIATRCDPTMLENLSRKLPDYLNEKWQAICVQKELENETISIMHLSNFLEKKLAVFMRIKASQSVEDDENYEENYLENGQTKSFKYKRNNESNSTPLYNNSKQRKPAYEYKCWVHQSDDHFIAQCPKAKELSGIEVFSLAKQLSVCTSCGKEKYSGAGHRCSHAPPPICRYHQNQRHWNIVCPTRPPLNRENNFKNSTNHNRAISGFPEDTSQSLQINKSQSEEKLVQNHSNHNFNQNSSKLHAQYANNQQQIPADVNIALYKGLNAP